MHLTYVPWIAGRRRAQDQADAAHGAEAARDRHPARRAAVPRRPHDPRRRAREDLAVHQRAEVRRDLRCGTPTPSTRCRACCTSRAWTSLICDKLRLNTPPANLSAGTSWCTRSSIRDGEVDIAMVGKYVDLSDSLQVAQRGAAPRRHQEPRAREDRLRRLRDDRRRDGVDAAREVSTRSWCPAASASAASKARSRAARFARENKRALPRHLPGHAGRDHRVRAPRGRPRRTPTAPSSIRDTPHPVIALITEWQDARRHDPEARRQLRPGRHHAPGRAELRRRARHAGARDLRRRGHRAPSPPLRGQRATTSTSCAGRAW